MSVLYGNDPVKNEINIKNLGEIRGFIYVSSEKVGLYVVSASTMIT